MLQEEHGEDAEHTQELAPMDAVYAMGDCCARMDLALPALAQVSSLQNGNHTSTRGTLIRADF